MKIISLTLLFGLLGYTISKPLDTKDATEALVEVEKQRLIKFPEEVEMPGVVEGKEKYDEAKRILQEIEKINQALGYVKKQSDQLKSPAILDSSQYLFPNAGYQPFHVQSPQVMGANGEALLLPSIRSVNLEPSYYNQASEYNVPPRRKSQKQKVSNLQNVFYFKPQRVELPAPQTRAEEQLLPTHFVIPVRLYKHNKQQYIEKQSPQEYKIKGYKIVGDIDHFYGKIKTNKTSSVSGSKTKTTPKYHLFFLPQEIAAKNSLTNIKASDDSSKENSSRDVKLTNRRYKVQANTQTVSTGNTVNSTTTSQIIKKRIVPRPLKGGNANSVVSASSSTVFKVPPTTNSNGQQQQTQLQQQTHTQQQQPQQQFQKPLNNQQIVQPPVATPSYTALNNQPTKPNNNQLIRPLLNLQNSINNNNNNANKNRPLLELQNNINNINNATSNAIKTAFQNIFRLPFRPQDPTKPLTATEYTPIETLPQQILPQQQQFFTALAASNAQQAQQPFYNSYFQNDHLESDYKWDDESASIDNSNSDDQENFSNSQDLSAPEEKKIFSHLIKHQQESQKEALKQGGIIIQKLKVRKGGIAIAGPGGVATAGSGGTAIVGPGGYALTHPRSLTIAGPGAKVIAIPSDVDLQDALQRTDLESKMFPREGRIVATGPTVYYSPPTGDFVDF